jgi:hypothetical protein
MADQTSEAYQQNYQEEQTAAAYNAAYRDRWTKRLSTQREFVLLDRMLGSQGRCKVLLDLPCGHETFLFKALSTDPSLCSLICRGFIVFPEIFAVRGRPIMI